MRWPRYSTATPTSTAGVVPALVETVAVIDGRSRQFEMGALLTGVDPVRAQMFDTLRDIEGNPVDLAALGPDEVYIDRDGAEELDARPGDPLGVAFGPGDLYPMTVKGIVDGWYSKRATTDVVLMLPLRRAQELLDRPGQLSFILVSNRGDAFAGVDLTEDILDRLGELPAIRDAGLELFDVKREIVDEANEIGNLFVTIFVTFGLFSIGVGLLLIFLILSMLAAERKSEMGMSRAVGMQRRHLVRMFTVEGAIYGVGSALVGAIAGIGLGYLLVFVTSGIFESDSNSENFVLTAHVAITSVVVSFLIGSVITLVTVLFAARRTSQLNIVRAIRGIPDPLLARAGRRSLIWGTIITVVGVLVLFAGLQSANLTAFSLGFSLIPIGMALILRWKGIAQRWVLTGTGLVLLVYWLLPIEVLNTIKEDWNQDFSIFFLSGAMVVTGAVLVIVNNSSIVLGLMTGTIGRVRRFAPIVKSAVAYPLRFGFRTGLSLAMFAVVVFSVTVMSVLLQGFDRLFDDEQRLAGGYEVMAFARSDLNPIADLASTVEADPELAFVTRVDGKPSVGTFRTIRRAEAKLSESEEGDFADTSITGVDDDFVESTKYDIKLTTQEFTGSSGVDSAAVWRALRDQPGLAIVNAFLVPTRNGFVFAPSSDDFNLEGVDGLFLENETMEPVQVIVRDQESATTFKLTVIGVLDDWASGGPVPGGIYTSTNTFRGELQREIDATQFFFNIDAGIEDGATRIESSLFEHGVETLDIREAIGDAQSANRAFFNLLIGFMTLGLVVGIVALGVISARAVVERRHEIGVMRAIGFSRRMVQMSFLAESSFIAVLGIVVGLILGLIMSVNIIGDIRTDEPNIQLIIPWGRLAVIGIGAYVFSLLTTYLPAVQASRIAPAVALRYE